jgi:hypothetical protein
LIKTIKAGLDWNRNTWNMCRQAWSGLQSESRSSR